MGNLSIPHTPPVLQPGKGADPPHRALPGTTLVHRCIATMADAGRVTTPCGLKLLHTLVGRQPRELQEEHV